MGRTGKSKGKTDTSKARERKPIKDLPLKDPKKVRGGFSDLTVTKSVDKGSPKLY